MEEVDITFKLTVTVSTALPALWRVVQTAFTSELVIQRTWEVLEVSTKICDFQHLSVTWYIKRSPCICMPVFRAYMLSQK